MKKSIILVLSVLCLLFMTLGVSASENADTTKYLPKVVTTKRFENIYYHTVFDSELAKTCRRLSSDTYNLTEENNAAGVADKDIAKAFTEEGFTDIYCRYGAGEGIYYADNFIVGVKSFEVNGEKKHVMVIAFRGTGDVNDAFTDASIFETNGYHYGFYTATMNAYETMKKYTFPSVELRYGNAMTFSNYLEHVKRYGDDYFLLLTGHSLGGATANILNAELSEEIGQKSLACYTFASPIVCSREKAASRKIYNTFNIINTMDPVPYVGLELINGVRHGIDFRVEVTDSESHAHNLKETYERATNQVVDNIESLSPDFYSKKYTITENDTTVMKDELHINVECSLDEGIFNGQLGNIDLVIKSNIAINTNITTNGNLLMQKVGMGEPEIHINSGTMQIGGDFYQRGHLDIGDAVVKVGGDFNKAGLCTIEKEGASLLINGNLNGQYFGGWSGYFTATAGILEVKGDIIDFTGYRASGTHKLILSGDKKQNIDMEYYEAGMYKTGQINSLEITNTSEEGVEITGTAHVTGELYMIDSSKVINSSNLVLNGSASVRGVWNGDLTASGWNSNSINNINGNLHIVGDIDKESTVNANMTVSGELKVLSGITLKISAGEASANNVIIEQRGNLIFIGSARMIVNGDLTTGLVSVLEIGPAEVIVLGNFTKSGKCLMDNNDGHFLINGNLTDLSNSFTATAGILEVKGDIVDFYNYKASGTHKLILSGDKKQKIDMEYYEAGMYKTGQINSLEITNTSEEGVEITDTAHVTGELYMIDSSKVINSSNLVLNGSASVRGVWNGDLTASGWNSNSINNINGNLHIVGDIDKESTVNANMTVSGELKVLSGITLKISAGEASANNVIIEQRGNLIFIGSARMIVNGDLTTGLVSVLEIGPAEVIVLGNFTKSGKCLMDNNDGHFLINGNLTDLSNSFTATAGVLEVKGDIVDFYNYKASGTHKLILSGDKKQNIDMEYYEAGMHKTGQINSLEITNTSEEGVEFVDYVNVLSDILQPVGTKITGRDYVTLQNKTAFVDYGEENSSINIYNGNAEDVIPAWLDYERYCKFVKDGDKAYVLNESITNTSFKCDLYFSNDYIKQSAVVNIAFYDETNKFVQMASKPVEVKAGKIDVSIDYESKPYSTYKIMVWESFDNIKPLMKVK